MRTTSSSRVHAPCIAETVPCIFGYQSRNKSCNDRVGRSVGNGRMCVKITRHTSGHLCCVKNRPARDSTSHTPIEGDTYGVAGMFIRLPGIFVVSKHLDSVCKLCMGRRCSALARQ